MTGMCLGQYSDNGIMRCAVTVPWFVVAIVVGLCAGLLLVLPRRK